MNVRITKNRSLHIGLLLSSIVLTPGCWNKEKPVKKNVIGDVSATKKRIDKAVSDGSAELVFIGGKAVITANMLEQEFEQLLNENPQIKQVLPFMPDAKKNFLIGLANQRIIERYVENNGINEQDDYKQELDRVHRAMRHMLNTKFFSAAHPVQVTDSEVNAFYDKHKTAIPDLLVSRGGVSAVGVKFAKEFDAKTFVAQSGQNNFVKTAKVQSKKVEDFKVVNSQTADMDATLRNGILSIKKSPAIKVVKVSDKEYWAVHATKIEEAQYRSLEQVKPNLVRMVEQEKQKEVLQKIIDGLKTEYNVVIKDDYFAKNAPQQANAMASNFGTSQSESVPARSDVITTV